MKHFDRNPIDEGYVLAGLIYDDVYFNKSIPHLKREYFDDEACSIVFSSIQKAYERSEGHVGLPEVKAVIESNKKLNEKQFNDVKKVVSDLVNAKNKTIKTDFLVSETEYFIGHRMYTLGVKGSISIAQGEDYKGRDPSDLMNEGLSFSFDSSVGLDFFDDVEDVWEELHREDAKIPFGVTLLDEVTKGGMSRKSLSAFMASTGGGKSLAMCHVAAQAMLSGFNVLYVTMEMAGAKIQERIYANVLDTYLDIIADLPKDQLTKKIRAVKNHTDGKLIVKEYPNGSAHAGHIRQLVREIKQKRGFNIDLVIVDYLNICASYRMSDIGNSYAYVKAVAEEMRGLATELDVAMLTATQTNRSGYNNKDMDITNTSQSIGLPETLDFFAALYTDEELQSLDMIKITQLKNRWNDLNFKRKFVVGVERGKMKLFDTDQSYLDAPDDAKQSKKKAKTIEFDEDRKDTSLFDKV